MTYLVERQRLEAERANILAQEVARAAAACGGITEAVRCMALLDLWRMAHEV